MTLPFNITNPGIYIAGLLTSAEAQFVTDLVGLTYSHGDILYVDSSNKLQTLGAGTSGQFLKTLGPGSDPVWASPAGGGDMLASTYDPNSVASDAFAMTNMNSAGWRLFYTNAAGDVTELAFGTSGYVLQSNGAAAAPSWVAAGSGDMTKAVYDPNAVAADAFNVDNHTSGTTNKVFTASEQSKLAGIEAGADVTDATNVAAAGAEMTSNKDVANGYAGLDASGKINSAQLPSLAISEFLGNFTDTTAALADAGVNASQSGDWFTVDTSGGQTYIVTTDSPTTTAHITLARTPTDTVTSVFGRTGAVTAQNNDYTWAQIDKTTSNIADITTRSHTSLTDIGTNTHAQIDAHIADTANPHGVTAAQVGALANVVEDTTPQLGGNLDINKKVVGDATKYNNGNSGTAFTIDWNNGQSQDLTLTGNVTLTFTAPTGINFARLSLRLIQDATGSRTVSFPSSVRWAGGTAPTLTTAANGIDIITFEWDGTNYDGVASLRFA